MKHLREFFIGLLQAVGVLLILLTILVLAACASGIQMSDEERIACRNEGCGVFTAAELRGLVNRAFEAGYVHGWSDATRQAGKDL